MRCQAFIFARGGSKGLPGKNIRPLAGKPLIAHAIEAALNAPSLGDVIVSTDDPEIAAVAKAFGARVPFMRPPELASDTAPEWHAWRHALEWTEAHEGAIDVMVCLPATAPFRAVSDVESCIAKLAATPEADAVITVTASERNPYFNMVTMSDGAIARLPNPAAQSYARRQDAPAVFDITPVAYAARAAFVRDKANLFDGTVCAIEVPRERALDIDTPYDFKLAELIAASGLGWSAGGYVDRLAERADMRGRVVALTGAAGHLGRAVAEAMVERGADLALIDRDAEGLDEAARALRDRGSRVATFTVDLELEDGRAELAGQVARELGNIDVLINNAAFVGENNLRGWTVPVEDQSLDTWRRAVEVNLTAPFHLTQLFLPMLQKSGHAAIVNISSIYGVLGPDLSLYDGTEMGNPAAYASSKGGLIQLTRWLATTLAPRVRVNCVSLGGLSRGQPESFVKMYEERTPLGRMGTEQDVAGAVSFFASDLSSWITGQNLLVDGGWSAW